MRLENAQQAARDGLSQVNEPIRDERLSPTQMREKTVIPTKARTLSNLFRSKSMRIISSSSNNNNLSHNYNHRRSHHQNQSQNQNQNQNQNLNNHSQAATIDYLSTARPHKRSLSINRNFSHYLSSTTATATADPSADTLSHKDFISSSGGGGKLVLFLRRLFRTKRNKQTARAKLELDYTENMRQSSLDNGRIIINNIHTTASIHGVSNLNDSSKHEKEPLKRPLNLLSSPSSDSSASNSLIEILDCSPAVSQSRRALREQHLVRERGRASWRMVGRSDSSLSELSDCSTTASERLRRHLDEAYKRHRNCTSQREKEFIDSINVLRQASRHALPQSARSSSKTRHATTKSVASGKSDLETSSSLAGSQSTGNCAGPDDTGSILAVHKQAQQPNCCICASYLESVARLCPLAAAATTCCPAAASACCPGLSLPSPPLSGASNPVDMCMCPLWRSMISNYSSGCQSADSPPPPPPPPLIFNPISAQTHHHQPQQLLLTQPAPTQFQLHNSNHHLHHHNQQQLQQQQQQHHNTTIDLKIEFGADSKPSRLALN